MAESTDPLGRLNMLDMTLSEVLSPVRVADAAKLFDTQKLARVREDLANLRMAIQYTLFDLEATRRENGYLRKVLEETSRDEDDDD